MQLQVAYTNMIKDLRELSGLRVVCCHLFKGIEGLLPLFILKIRNDIVKDSLVYNRRIRELLHGLCKGFSCLHIVALLIIKQTFVVNNRCVIAVDQQDKDGYHAYKADNNPSQQSFLPGQIV